jgi:hypothetical protein
MSRQLLSKNNLIYISGMNISQITIYVDSYAMKKVEHGDPCGRHVYSVVAMFD